MVDLSAEGFRLPLCEEWEYAALAGNGNNLYPWGNTLSKDVANWWGHWLDDDGELTEEPHTLPVKTFAPNAYGLYDMVGNAYEHLMYLVDSPLALPQTAYVRARQTPGYASEGEDCVVSDWKVTCLAPNNPIAGTAGFRTVSGGFPYGAIEVEPKACDVKAGHLTISWKPMESSPDGETLDETTRTLQEMWLKTKPCRIWRGSADFREYDDFSKAEVIGIADAGELEFTDKDFGKLTCIGPVTYWVEVCSGTTSGPRPDAAPASCVTGRRFAILCGFGPKECSGNAHSHTTNEVQWMRQALRKDEGLLEKEYDCTNLKGTVDGLTNAWSEAAADTKPGDTLFFYISTHGGAAANGQNGTFLEVFEGFYTSGIMRKDLEKFPATNGVKVINIIDACFSGAMHDDNRDVDQDNKAWICSSTKDQLSACVVSVSQFAQTFMKWGWLDGCADLAKLANVKYENPHAGDGLLSLWEVANYSQALVSGSAWQDGEDRPNDNVLINLKHKQTVMMAGEDLLKSTIVATDIDSPRTAHVPDKLNPWVGWRKWVMSEVECDFSLSYFSWSSNCEVRVNSELPWMFYDVEYGIGKQGDRSYARAIKAEDQTVVESLLGKYVGIHLYENGANFENDEKGDKWWLNIYGNLNHKEKETLGVEYVPLERGETYALRIRAVNEYGFGPWSKSISFETGKKDEETISISSSSDTSVSGFTVAAVSREGEDLHMEVAVSRTDGSQTVYEGTVTMDAERTMLSGSLSCDSGTLALSITKEGIVSASSDALTITGQLAMSGAGDAFEFLETEVTLEENETAEIRVIGGHAERASSVKVYLTYNTAAETSAAVLWYNSPLQKAVYEVHQIW